VPFESVDLSLCGGHNALRSKKQTKRTVKIDSARVLQLRDEGKTYKEIGECFGIIDTFGIAAISSICRKTPQQPLKTIYIPPAPKLPK
jgi:hypothetical protein